MELKAWFDEVGIIGSSEIPNDDGEIWYSRFDGSYITRVGLEKDMQGLADRDITEQLTHGVGFSPTRNKWYGWSHRAIYGFTIGSTCKRGDCHYRPVDVPDTIRCAIEFWEDKWHLNTYAKRIAWNLILVFWTHNHSVPNRAIRGRMGSAKVVFDPNNFGKGEWVAKTMEDAKQMAIDFNRGVS